MSAKGGNVKKQSKKGLAHDIPKGFEPGSKPGGKGPSVRRGGARPKPPVLKSVVPKKKKK